MNNQRKMKMKMNRLQIGCIAAVCAFFFLGNVQAVTMQLQGADGSNLMTNGGTMSLGTVINNIGGQFGGQAERDALMVNNLRTMALDQVLSTFPDGQEYHRSTNAYVSPVLGIATTVGAVIASGGGLNVSMGIVTLTLPATFQYLVVAYDGPNGGVIVYEISSLAAGTVIEMPQFARPSGAVGSQSLVQHTGQYGMTGWSLLNPTQTTVPDGGATVMLLGAALAGLGAMRRFLKS
jgi:hypothetical protein